VSLGLSLFGVLVQEREPLSAADVPNLLATWLQDAGGFAAAGLALVGLYLLVRRQSPWGPHGRPLWFKVVFMLACFTAVAWYLPAVFIAVASSTGFPESQTAQASVPPILSTSLTIGGLGAVIAAGLPFLYDIARMRGRRIWGLAVLSIKEGYHRWVLWIFGPFIVVFLVGGWFVPHKPESQLSTYVQIIYWVMTPLLLVTAALLAAFSIPNDVRSHAIATIVTKPVERFEIVLGRFLGYTVLMSGILFGMVLLSLPLIYALGVPKEAEVESLRARVPIYGDLRLQGKSDEFKGVQTGREWQYRKYIAGQSPHRAIWFFHDVPGRLDERATVPCEFYFDVYRLRKAEKEGQGIFCSFTFQSRHWDPSHGREYQEDLKAARQRAADPDAYAQALDLIAEKFGLFEVPFKEVTDAHTYTIDVPAGLFRNAGRRTMSADDRLPLVAVTVKCESAGQLVGMARPDLYFVDGEGYFGLNYIKGALGLWFSLCLVIGVAVACSTYLSGVVSLVVTLFLFLAGFSTEYIRSVALGKNPEGGPLEALRQIVSGPGTPAFDPTTQASNLVDDVFRWYLRRVLNMLPDVPLYNLTDYVANGFDISMTDLALRTLVLVGYLLPWAVVAYYLLKSREVAA
jgi:ABC-type transport system involved in multi-copper enzyme maturation permease subunit